MFDKIKFLTCSPLLLIAALQHCQTARAEKRSIVKGGGEHEEDQCLHKLIKLVWYVFF